MGENRKKGKSLFFNSITTQQKVEKYKENKKIYQKLKIKLYTKKDTSLKMKNYLIKTGLLGGRDF